MSKIIDCLLIGHNETPFVEYEKTLRFMGTSSGAYRNFSLGFIRYENNPYTVPEIYNLFHHQNPDPKTDPGPLSLGNVFCGGIAYLGTYLYRRGFSFDYVNSFRNEKEYLIEQLQNENIRLIAILTTLYVSVQPILEVVALIKKYNDSAKIVLGGPFIAAQIRMMDEVSLQYLFKLIEADFYVNSSQGESTLVSLLRALREDLPFSNINNLFYKDKNKYINTPIEVEDNKLEDNTVDWSLFSDRLEKITSVRTSVSCPFSCAYCEFPLLAGNYQTISVSAIERELDSIARRGKVTGISFIDDTFNVPPQRFKEILRMIIKNGYEFRWNCFFRCQFTDRETVSLMKESGCEGVYLGIESASQVVLDHMNKTATVDQYKRGIELLKEFDINMIFSTMVGFPGETTETVQETKQFIEECEPAFFYMHLWYCSLFAPIWKKREQYHLKGSQYEWSHATMDSHTAGDLIEDLFCSIKKSVYVPQCNFDYAGVINLLHRGMRLDQVKNFLKYFNEGLREKLANPGLANISAETAEKLKSTCQ